MPPLALVLFGGSLEAGKGTDRVGETPLTVDGWIKFSVPTRLQKLLVDTRARLDSILKKKIEDPGCDFSLGSELLSAVIQLLADASTLPPAGSQAKNNMTKAQAWGDQAVKSWGGLSNAREGAFSANTPAPTHAPPPGLIASGGSGTRYQPSFLPGAGAAFAKEQGNTEQPKSNPYLTRPGEASGSWEEVKNDKAKGRKDAVYYVNRLTGESSWTKPTGM